MHGLKGRLAGTIGAQGIRLALAFGTGVVISRALQPEGRGAYTAIVTAGGLAIAAAHLSLEKTQVAHWRDAGRRPALTANALLAGLALGGIAAVVAALCGLPWPVVAAIPAGVAVINLTTVATLLGRLAAVNSGMLVAAVLQCGGLLAVAAFGGLTVGWVVFFWAVATVCPLLTLLPATRPRRRDADAALAARCVGTGARYHVGQLAWSMLLRGDLLVLGALAGPAAVGLYSLALTLTDTAGVPADAVRQALLAGQAEAADRDAAAVTARALRLCLLAAAGTTALLCLAAPVVIPLVYGAAFAGSVVPLLALAPGVAILAGTRPLEAYLVRLDRPLTMTALSVAALAVDLGLNLLLAPALGATGSALAATVAYAFLGAGRWWWFAASRVPRTLQNAALTAS